MINDRLKESLRAYMNNQTEILKLQYKNHQIRIDIVQNLINNDPDLLMQVSKINFRKLANIVNNS